MPKALLAGRSRLGGVIFLIILTGLLAGFIKNGYYLSVLTFIAINSIIAIGLCLLLGYAGQVSLGHAAFFGLGAYTTAIITTRLHWSPWLSLPMAILLTCLIAYFIGRPTLSLRGHYLAMATLGFGVIIQIIMKEWLSFTGGNSGLSDIPALYLPRLHLESSERGFFCVASSFMILALIFAANVADSRAGRALRAVHGSEAAAATSGVDIARYKLKVFVLSAGYAAVAGFLYSHYVKFISPQPFDFKFSVELVVMVVLGGVGSVWGGLLGAALLTILNEVLRKFNNFDIIAFGIVLMLVLIFLPQGLVGIWDRLRAIRRPVRIAATAVGEEAK
jgi:branched-chain amino acid transport system permease protein